MNSIYCSCAFCALFLSMPSTAHANIDTSFHGSTSSVKIESNPKFDSVSKPAYPQYASVSFLQSETKLDFNGGEPLKVSVRCKMAGYYTTKAECAQKGSKYGPKCSDDKSLSFTAEEKNEADGYVAGCCGKNFSVADPEACPNNSSYSGNSCPVGSGQGYNSNRIYECVCNRNTYAFGADNPCPSSYSPDEKTICQSVDKSGKTQSYYKTCCPTTGKNAYTQCDVNGHLLGSGNSCLVSGKTLYEKCVCDSRYDTRKSNCKTFLLDGSDVCRLNSVDYIQSENCYTVCSNSSYEDLDRFYTDGGLGFVYSIAKNLGLMEE